MRITRLKPPTGKTESPTGGKRTSAELSRHFEYATGKLMRDIRAVELAEKESWAKIRRREIT